MATKYFIQPFATAGDRISIPEPIQGSGSVSYNQGYGPDYELEIGVDPDAKPIERDEMNSLFYEITNAIGLVQRWGFPNFITTADNGGAPFSYGIGAGVVFAFAATPTDFKVYISIAAANTTSPESDPSKWQQLGASGGLPTATTVVAGITRYATNPEAAAGVVTTAAVTPSNLALFAQLSGAAFTGAVTGISFDTPSDISLKDNVRPYSFEGKYSPSALGLMSWTWNENAPGDLAGTEDSGVIAQDVERVFPSCVSRDKNGVLHVNYGKLAVHLILSGRA